MTAPTKPPLGEATTNDSSQCCISGVCDYHNAINTAAAEKAAAHTAHGTFVAAARWAKANRWTYDRTVAFGQREWRWRNESRTIRILDQSGNGPDELIVESDHGFASIHSIGVQQAIDHLVTAEILPAEFHSLAPKPVEPKPELQTAHLPIADRCLWCNAALTYLDKRLVHRHSLATACGEVAS